MSADFNAVIERVEAGEPVRAAIVSEGVDTKGFYRALASDAELGKRYARAKLIACEAYADETLQIADEEPPKVQTQHGEHTDAGYVQWQRNRIETRKWHLAKLMPKVYGDRLDVDHTGTVTLAVEVAEKLSRARDRLRLVG